MVAGIEPQSSWIFKPTQPVSSCSTQRRGLVRVAAPEETEIDRPCSAACSILPTLNGPPKSMPTVIGPSEPPSIVVMPDAIACSQSPGRIEMHMHVDSAGRGDHPFAIAHGGGRRNEKPGIDAIHDGGIAGLAEANDAAVFDAEVTFDDADHRVDDQNIAEEQVERALRARHSGCKPDAVAQRLAAAVQAFIAIDGVILLDDRDQRRVGKRTPSPTVGPYKSRIVSARDRDHGDLTRP